MTGYTVTAADGAAGTCTDKGRAQKKVSRVFIFTSSISGVCGWKKLFSETFPQFEATGQSGRNPPEICGTNTGYHSKLSRVPKSLQIFHNSSS